MKKSHIVQKIKTLYTIQLIQNIGRKSAQVFTLERLDFIYTTDPLFVPKSGQLIAAASWSMVIIAAAVYEYQADCGGEWSEIQFDFASGIAEIVRLAGWDTTVTNLFAKAEKLPKETLIAFEK